ncbi:MAG: DUF2781 domain-containing protein [Anaerolineae bacterium]|nr:DUF2781 domain-containing protein [Anaerolineae bacterium]
MERVTLKATKRDVTGKQVKALRRAGQLPAVIYATMISTITGIIVFGVEFFGEPQYQTTNAVKFLAFNIPYVAIPLLLLVRMRAPMMAIKCSAPKRRTTLSAKASRPKNWSASA